MKWINVKDKLPNSDNYVLICLHGKFLRTSYYFEDSFGKWFSSTDGIWDKYYTDAVTHWMPLPEPPSL